MIRVGSAVNGASSESTRSRTAARRRGSPPSCASAHTSVAGASDRHSTLRGPTGTASNEEGRSSVRGMSATSFTWRPAMSHTAVSVGKLKAGTM